MPAREHVLVVDDDPSIVDVVQALLQDEDYDVSVAFNGKEALEAVSSGLKPDIILLDIMMPILDGWGFWQATRSLDTLSQVPIVIVSADSSMPDKATEAEVPAYLHKPFDVEDLLLTIQKLLERRAEHSYQAGYRAGRADGHQNGYSEGYRAGRADGRQDGYREGYDSGHRDGRHGESRQSC